MRSASILLVALHFASPTTAIAQERPQLGGMYIFEVDTTSITIDEVQGIPVQRLYAVRSGDLSAEDAEGISSAPINESFDMLQTSTNILKVPMASKWLKGEIKAFVGFGNGDNQYGGGKGGPIFAGPPIKIPPLAPDTVIALGRFTLDSKASAAIEDAVPNMSDKTMVFITRK